jgi:ribosome-associated translation inhibitor RaiA
MEIHVRTRVAGAGERVRDYVERRLRFSLGRFSRRILRVTVRIVDLNGPRGGVDKVCRIEVRLLPAGCFLAEDWDSDLHAAIDRAAERVARSVSRAINRAHHLEREGAALGRILAESGLSEAESMDVAHG